MYGAGYLYKSELLYKGDIPNPQDRYNYGMNVIAPYYKKHGTHEASGAHLNMY